MKRKLWLGNAILLVLSVAFVLVCLEIAARYMMARREVITIGEQSVYTEPDALLGWKNRPGASVEYNRAEYRTQVTINSLGFRDVERSAARTPGLGRILAIGDSFIEGYTVERDQSVTRRLESLSVERGCPVEVLNAGVHGYSTDQEALWYDRDGADLEPDVVLVFLYYNDILNTVRERYWGSPTPLTEIVDGRLVVTNLPLPVVKPISVGVRVKEFPHEEGSALKALLIERILSGAPKVYARGARLGLWPAYDPENVTDELRAFKVRGQLTEIQSAFTKTEGILTLLSNRIKENHAAPVLVYIPASFEVSDRNWNVTLARYGLDASAWDRTAVRTRLSGMAARGGWTFVDLVAPLRSSVSLLGGDPYFPLDGHWNVKGHDTAARALSAFLGDHGLLPCGEPATAPPRD